MVILTISTIATLCDTNALGSDYQQVAQRLKESLALGGHQVLEGRFQVFNKEDCEEVIPTFGQCFGNNPATPYLLATVPGAPGEYQDPYYGDFAGIVEAPYQATYRLKADEALVVIGKTPPQAAYFGFQSYLFSRLITSGVRRVADNFFEGALEKFFGATPNPERFYQFAAISDSFNERVLARGLEMSFAWQQEFAVISTANRKTAELVSAQLIASGMDRKRIYVEELPSQMRLGLDRFADDLAGLARFALPRDDKAGAAWLANPTLKLLRVSPKRILTSRYGEFVPEQRGGFKEDGLRAGLDQIVDAVSTKLPLLNQDAGSSFVPLSSLGLQGQQCIKSAMNCLGDTFDTDTYRAGGLGLLASSDVWVIVGINHTLTGNATYISLSVNNMDFLIGTQSVSQTGSAAGFLKGELVDSVARVLGADVSQLSALTRANLNKYYVRLFARDCTGLPECTVVSKSTLPESDQVTLLQRAYIQPGSLRGAEPTLMVSPKILKAQRK